MNCHHETLRQHLQRANSKNDWRILQERLNLCACTKSSSFSPYFIDDEYLLFAVRLEAPLFLIEFLLQKMHHLVLRNDYYSHHVYNAILPTTSDKVIAAFMRAGKKYQTKKRIPQDDELMLPDAYSLLERAMSTPNARVVDLLLCKFPELLTHMNERGNLPLHEACTHCTCCSIVKIVLKHMQQTSLNKKYSNVPPAFLENRIGKTSLQLASNCLRQMNSKAVLSSLLETIPNPTIQNIDSHNLLHLAAQTDNIDLANDIIANDPLSTQRKDLLDNLALHIACFYGSSQVLNLLLSQSSRNQSLDGNCCCHTPLHLACMNSTLSVSDVQRMLGYDYHPENNEEVMTEDDGRSARLGRIKEIILRYKLLHFCAQGANIDVASTLLSLSPGSLHEPDDLGKLPIHVACERGSSSMVQLLLQRGLEVNLGGPNGAGGLFYSQRRPQPPSPFQSETGIHLACLNSNMTRESISQLLDAANITEDEIQRWGLLHLTARGGNVHVASVLVDRCPQYLMQEDSYGPIHWACYNTQPSMLRFLLQKGVKYQYNFLLNRTPLHILLEKFGKKEERSSELFLTDTTVENEDETDKIWECIEACLETTLSNGQTLDLDSSKLYSKKDTPRNTHINAMLLQHEAIRILPLHILELAIKRFGSTYHLLSSSDLIGETSLHVVADVQQYKYGNWEKVIQCLLDLDGKCGRSSAQIFDKKGQLPLHMAIKNGLKFTNGLSDIVGAYPISLDVTDELTGLYPFMLAAVCKNSDLETSFELLRENPTTLHEHF